jgi:hypothetical protein
MSNLMVSLLILLFVNLHVTDHSCLTDFHITLLRTKKIEITETRIEDQPINGPSRAVSVYGSISSPSSSSVNLIDDDDDLPVLPSTTYTPATSPESSGYNDVELIDAPAPSTPTCPAISPITPVLHDKASTLSLKRHRLTDTPCTGYPGQFTSHEHDYLSSRKEAGETSYWTSGKANHANGLFSHSTFIHDPLYPEMSYTERSLNAQPARELAHTHAHNKTINYTLSEAVTAQRSESDEMLRREVHRESSMARLEGVSVGEYRYYQGFLTLEEYRAARLCVCWGYCWCAKLCTRYPDVLCPCSEYIEIHDDDD